MSCKPCFSMDGKGQTMSVERVVVTLKSTDVIEAIWVIDGEVVPVEIRGEHASSPTGPAPTREGSASHARWPAAFTEPVARDLSEVREGALMHSRIDYVAEISRATASDEADEALSADSEIFVPPVGGHALWIGAPSEGDTYSGLRLIAGDEAVDLSSIIHVCAAQSEAPNVLSDDTYTIEAGTSSVEFGDSLQTRMSIDFATKPRP